VTLNLDFNVSKSYIDALGVLSAQLMHDLFAIAKFLVFNTTPQYVLNTFDVDAPSFYATVIKCDAFKGPFVATQLNSLNSTSSGLASAGRYRHFADATQLNSTSS